MKCFGFYDVFFKYNTCKMVFNGMFKYIIQKDGKMDATEEIDDKRALDFFSRAMSESRRYVCFSIFVYKYLIYTKSIGI